MTTEQLAAGQQAPPLCDEQGPIPEFPPAQFDPVTGRVILPSPEEMAARMNAALRALRALGQLPDDDPEETFEEALRDFDESRPPGRKMFEGMY